MSLTEYVHQYSEFATNMQKKVKKSFEDEPKKFAEKILSFVEDDNLRMVEAMSNYVNIFEPYSDGFNIKVLKICLAELPWKYYKIHKFVEENCNIRALWGLNGVFDQVLSSDQMSGRELEFITHLINKECEVFSSSSLCKFFRENIKSL